MATNDPLPTPVPSTVSIPSWKAKKRQRLAEEALNRYEQLDAYQRFQSEPQEDFDTSFDVIGYWLAKRTIPGMEGLAAMALDVLIVSLMSAEPERVFSSSGNLLTYARLNMEDDMVEAIESIKSYERDGFPVEINGTSVDLDEFDAIVKDLEAEIEVTAADRGEEE